MTYFITLIVATCSILYELILAQSLTALLGHSVLRYSVTIGLYLFSLGIGAWLCDRQKCTQSDPRRRLFRIELWLSLVGGIAVIYLNVAEFGERLAQLYLIYHFNDGSGLSTLMGWLSMATFAVLLHLPIVIIGLLSGFEIPLLVGLRQQESREEGELSRVLAIDYFGSLVGALLFPLLLLPNWGLYTTAFATAALNGVACLLLLERGQGLRNRRVLAPLAAIVMMLAGIAQNQAIEQFFMKYLYYFMSIYNDPGHPDLLNPLHTDLTIERIPSQVQNINLIPYRSDFAFHFRGTEHAPRKGEAPPITWVLKLDHHTQWSSAIERFYHEPFAHIPIQLKGEVPKDVLILGGGDGLLARELLKYRQVEHITEVELDPAMIHMARTHPLVRKMNQDSLDNPRVTVVEQEALRYLTMTPHRFDAIYADFPVPNDYNLGRLYSVEFFLLLRTHLVEGGYGVIDVPFEEDREEWSIVKATADEAGLHDLTPFGEPYYDKFLLFGIPQRAKHSWIDWHIPLRILNPTWEAHLLDYGNEIRDNWHPAQANTLTCPKLPILDARQLRVVW